MVENQENQTIESNDEKRKAKKPMFKCVCTTLGAGVIGSVLTLTIAPQLDYFSDDKTTEVLKEVTATEQDNSSVNVEQVTATTTSTSTADIVEKASKAIVGITNIQNQQSVNPFGNGFGQNQNGGEVASGTGSGVIYKVTDDVLYIVTNHHVIEGATEIELTLYDESVVTAELVGSDSLTDIAVLKVNGSYDITPVAVGDSSELRAGDKVIAIGNPLGLDLYGTVTQGIVSAVNRTIETSNSAGAWETEVIQTDAAINPGNSGGALINTSGELVGINSMKIAEENVEGLGFAIPSNDVVTIIDELTKNGQIVRPYLGVSMVNLSEIPQYYLQNISRDITDGVVVAAVDENSTAAQAGLQMEDIIVSINDQKISDSSELRQYLYTKLAVGDVATIQFYRNGEFSEVDVTLESTQQINE
ncbi:S1C family serine protease [Virgibacillus ndiopensis]|uniref:S1C family serine protease n=1 Tax=Virgibacillus ndiopensis TaxID=2004408 RepID=UPI001FE67643|nr:trypsin-like peptidase domain-containing protein [Virgibacillus ndiopensis]